MLYCSHCSHSSSSLRGPTTGCFTLIALRSHLQADFFVVSFFPLFQSFFSSFLFFFFASLYLFIVLLFSSFFLFFFGYWRRLQKEQDFKFATFTGSGLMDCRMERTLRSLCISDNCECS
jgi:hypothetical protein